MASPVAMQLFSAAILTVVSQFLLGGLILSSVAYLLGRPAFRRGGHRRRWRVAWTDAALGQFGLDLVRS